MSLSDLVTHQVHQSSDPLPPPDMALFNLLFPPLSSCFGPQRKWLDKITLDVRNSAAL